MNSTNVLTSDGVGMPRRCATQTPTGSIDAATIEAASIFFGVAGMIIDETRIATVFHDRCSVSVIGIRVQVLSTAMPIAFSTKYSKAMSLLVCAECPRYGT